MDSREHRGHLGAIGCLTFRQFIVIAVVFLSLSTLSDAADELYWQAFDFGKTTPDEVVLLFGPPATIKTEERYSDWIKNQASGCGQLRTYAMNYSIWAGDLNILKGPLGKASEVYIVIDNGKVSEVVWTYDNNQLEPAFDRWMNHKGLTKVPGKKPAVVMIGIWKPKKGTTVTVDCYTGGLGAICRGPISVHYSQNAEK
ncbi:MAG: hypothetical protein NT047_02915 [Deltaproteobacteria bacterium]|nr:hypothetical protein [Deltaproteobacteria bacterium]